jgi:tetratricopeptide (TPR) repeat protein
MELRNSDAGDLNLGVTLYYLGNAYRDLDDFETAIENYRYAERVLEKVGDTFNLCRLYSDWSWLLYLDGEMTSAVAMNEKSHDLAIRGAFGTEISEYWHTRYHLTIDEGDASSAYQYLESGLESARRYQNVYMILDTLHHSVQRAAVTGKPEHIPGLLAEMESLEEQGCGIRQFRGRALVYYGDTFFDTSDHAKAVALWLEGLALVAEFGNSRTNEELFNDTLAPRREALARYLPVAIGSPLVADALVRWRDSTFTAGFPEMMKILATADL